jgi:hypothetical protein
MKTKKYGHVIFAFYEANDKLAVASKSIQSTGHQ